MGNANSIPAKTGDASAAGSTEISGDPAIKRYPINQLGRGQPAAQGTSAAIPRQMTERPSSAARLGRTASFFGRASSHDGASTPRRNRSRSGSLTGFLAHQRRGSATAAMIAADTPATVKEAREPTATHSPSALSPQSQDQAYPFGGYDISNPASGSGIETAIRANPRTRRLTEGLLTPATSGGFDPLNYVSPHPSPSVATQAQYAAGLPSHHAPVGVSSGLRVSSTGIEAESVPASAFRGSEPQQVPSTIARAPHRHPLFGVGGTSLFPGVGTSVGTNPAASPPVGGSSPVLSSQPMNLGDGNEDVEGSQRRLTALPSYLKIPTAIPSSHVSPSSPPASIYSQHSDRFRNPSERQRSPSPSLMVPLDDSRPAHVVAGAGAAAAVLNTEDVVIPPGDASKASSPMDERTFFGPQAVKNDITSDGNSVEAARAAGIDVTDLPSSLSQQHSGSAAEASKTDRIAQTDDNERESRTMQRTGEAQGAPLNASRTPTPTPSGYGPRALTPTRKGGASGLRSLSPVAGPSTSTGPPSQPISTKRSHVDVQTGGESGYNTPLLPPGLTSAPPSASVPGVTPLSEVSPPSTSQDRSRLTEATKATSATGSTGNASQPSTPASAKTGTAHQHDHHLQHTQTGQHQAALMPIVLTWRAGGREVFVTGTFANEWRSKILLHKSKRDHTCVLHLPPGTHRLKFIVDDRWRVSRDLPTATDGDGNLVNYVEIPNVGPAHPGPLSAPGEDLPGAGTDGNRGERNSKLESKKTTMNLVEEARRAEAMRLDDLFDDDAQNQEETWTCEIPAALIEAQEAEEALRDAEESGQLPPQKHSHGDDALPLPPALPRQLEKVILNSSPANPSNGTATAGSTVDDNSILPAPNHVVLNHLTASSIKGGVLAVGTTTRYKRKYVTTVYYRPVHV
ncbi:related to SIP2 - subunit of the Snf1 serine/threonine protein kinase complex [Melanopsichium pennsylvanicum]|uniref:Related to SIP2 - subunit of the Snf1 serine/threonine protein kinase complex n=2 Tax=Melanopsichium pennsylvanicum TaxID=63383 RepID=A0AAJ4XKK2_9BASI|nr:related to SIP2-subunit of the Snf1 serine/threonine protein kinase complex [Melanopsichium pennsylvanicum 4]SNX84064.1 related to SIP2 - subunit of the Snf1 serine/threonine protein kinase complex [Melanopsichium pennsylvanicum]